MKFTHQLKFNAVPEWKEHYINYPLLKKIIYATRAAECQEAYDGVPYIGDEEAAAGFGGSFRSPRTSSSGGGGAGGVRAPLLPGGAPALARSGSLAARAGDSEFIKALDGELARIISFYLRKEGELVSQFEALSLQLHTRDGCDAPSAPTPDLAAAVSDGAAGGGAPSAFAPASGGAAGAGGAAPPAPAQRAEFQRRVRHWASNDKATAADRERYRQRLVALFVQLDGLKKYLEMNHTGFRKILKKHDKETTQVGRVYGARPAAGRLKACSAGPGPAPPAARCPRLCQPRPFSS